MDQRVARGGGQRARERARVGMCRARMREVELGQCRRHAQQHQRVQADDGQVDREAGVAEQRHRHRDADLHAVAEHRGHGAHARRRGRAVAAALAPALRAVDREQQRQRGHEERRLRGPRQRAQVELRGGAEQQRRHEDVEGRVAEHARRVLDAVARAEPARAAGDPAQRDGAEDREQLVENGGRHAAGHPPPPLTSCDRTSR